jgi:hypothetical protein
MPFTELKDKMEVKINGVPYIYESAYKRLERVGMVGSRSHPAIACPLCHGTMFSIVYGNWECIADCPCGHSMTIYDG